MSTQTARWKSLALWSCAALFIAWSWAISWKFYTLQYTGWDLALCGQLMWALTHGTTHTSLFGGSFLVDHATYIAFLLTPFYFFFQSALTLLILKAGAFFAGAYILFLFASRRLGPAWGFMFMLGYVFYPANVAMLFFEFNFENLALPLILLAFYQTDKKKWGSFLATMIVLCLIKENMPLLVMMFGLFAVLSCRHNATPIPRPVLFLLLAGSGLFLLQLLLIQPLLTKGLSFHQSNYWEFYHSLGHSPREIITTFFLSPQTTLSLLFTKRNLLFLAELFGPLSIPALLSPGTLLIGLPLFLQHLLSSNGPQQSITYYYASTLAIFVFVAAIKGISTIPPTTQKRLLPVILVSVLIFNLAMINEWKSRLLHPDLKTLNGKTQLLSLIPPDAGVITNYEFLPALSQRKYLYLLDRERVSFTRTKETVPNQVSYALFDTNAPRTNGKAIKKHLTQPWGLRAFAGDTFLLEKNAPWGMPLLRVHQGPSIPLGSPPLITMGRSITLEQLSFPAVFPAPNRPVPITFLWKALKDLPEGFRVQLTIKQNKKNLWDNERYIAYNLPLGKNERLEDLEFYQIPSLPSGDYEFQVQIKQDIELILKEPQQESAIFTRAIHVP